MPTEPEIKRTFAFIDGQNLFHCAKESFGYRYPNYNAKKLAEAVCYSQGWRLDSVCFYTGIPDAVDNEYWNHFWTAKLATMGRQGIKVYSRHLRYRNQTVFLPDGSSHSFLVGQEKGIDIRIALDIVRSARLKKCDVILVFSQDQDLSEVSAEIRTIAHEQDRWIKSSVHFPLVQRREIPAESIEQIGFKLTVKHMTRVLIPMIIDASNMAAGD